MAEEWRFRLEGQKGIGRICRTPMQTNYLGLRDKSRFARIGGSSTGDLSNQLSMIGHVSYAQINAASHFPEMTDIIPFPPARSISPLDSINEVHLYFWSPVLITKVQKPKF